MPDLQTLINNIDNLRMDAELNVVSSHSSFRSVLQRDARVRALLNHLYDHPRDHLPVFMHITKLLKDHPDPHYAHPHDAIIAVLLYVVGECGMYESSRYALRFPKLFWAKRIAEDNLTGMYK